MAAPAPSRQVATEQRPRREGNRGGDNTVERVILNVLNELFGN